MASKRWLLSIIFLFLGIYFAFVTSQFETHNCSNEGNYSTESSYKANLNTLLGYLSSHIGDRSCSEFCQRSEGETHGNALCRGDVEFDTCHNCVNTAAQDIVKQCPNQYEAIIWYDYCMLRYSDEPIYGIPATDPPQIICNGTNVTNPEQFKEVRKILIEDLKNLAADGGTLRKAKGRNRTMPNNHTIYGMAQCTPDLSPDNCRTCLDRAATNIPGSKCDNTSGARIYTPSCFIRYDDTLFYDLNRLQESPSAGNDDANRTRTIIIVVVSIVVFLTLASGVGIFVRKRIKLKREGEPETGEAGDEISTVESIQYDFGKIRSATNNFSNVNKLGQGGFGAVYRGKLQNGREIAVKRLSRDSGQGDSEFKNEVLLVARLQHRNLVRLLGFSIHGIERLLVYEFVRNGSLDHFIFDRAKSLNLDWDKRYKIVVGVARGLLYLHEDSRLRIIHRDLKASNVLLDEEMNPKISDFGMAKLVVPDATQESTSRIVGTYGYMAPEYATQGHFSIKSDVYSFGVLVLEIVSGQKKLFLRNGQNSEDLLSYAWRSWREGTSANVIDPILVATSGGSQLDMLRCIHIALLCVQENPDDRPTMASVVVMLNSFSLTLPLPSEPGFYIPTTSSDASFSPVLHYNSKQMEASKLSKSLLPQPVYLSADNSSIFNMYPR